VFICLQDRSSTLILRFLKQWKHYLRNLETFL
jgi:hypothetical protein